MITLQPLRQAVGERNGGGFEGTGHKGAEYYTPSPSHPGRWLGCNLLACPVKHVSEREADNSTPGGAQARSSRCLQHPYRLERYPLSPLETTQRHFKAVAEEAKL